jgi:hypothetical protein
MGLEERTKTLRKWSCLSINRWVQLFSTAAIEASSVVQGVPGQGISSPCNSGWPFSMDFAPVAQSLSCSIILMPGS